MATHKIADTSRWYVVATKPAREFFAAGQLRNQGFEVFSPKRKTTMRHVRKLVTRARPLFPGYLFVHMRLDAIRWRAINGTLGVKFILSQDERPVPLPKGFVEAIMAHAGPDGMVTYAPDLKVGDKVTLMAGPFANEIGELIAKDDRGRVEVLMRFVSSVAVKTTQDNLLPA
jgi:transcriptional antiterminator RfaH